jgi:murein DD-endopeptidase MepM/ murein hydrolase activator NlpD
VRRGLTIASETFRLYEGFANVARFAAIFAGVAVLWVAAASAYAQAPQPQPQPAGEGDPGASAPALPAEPGRIGDGGVGPGGGDGGDDGGGKPDKGDGKPGKGNDNGGGKPGKGCGKGKGGCKNRGPLRLTRAEAKPSKAWFGGPSAVFRFAIDGRRKRNVVVQLARKGGKSAIVRRWVVRDVRPRDDRTIVWDGRLAKKRYAKQGNYKFKVRAKNGAAAVTKNATGKPKVGFFMNKFPVRGAHSYGDGLGAGRGHRGVDVFARCGVPLEAARGGKVQHEAYQGSGAGHYLVIDGRGTGKDYVYMHLQGASRLEPGDRVRTGQRIGRVGESGNAQGCHLYFELWGRPARRSG